MSTCLEGFNYADYLMRKLMVGQIDPWRRTDDGTPLYCLLTSVKEAMDECELWSKRKIDKSSFVDYLKINDILMITNVNEIEKVKKVKREKKELSPERLKTLQIQAEKMRKLKGTSAIPSIS
jgi:hypothetical protein